MSTTPTKNFNLEKAKALGILLKSKREEKNISIGEAAERLKLTAKQIEIIENGDYDLLPEPVFVRGFVRSYGRFLGLDDAQTAVELDEIIPSLKKSQSSNAAKPGEKSINYQQKEVPKSFPRAIPLALAAVVLVGVIIAWQSKSNAQTEQDTAESSLQVGQMAEPSLPSANAIVVPLDSLEASAAAASELTQENNAAGASEAVSSDSAVAANELSIKVRFRSNLVVTDADGKVLKSGIVAANSEHKFNDGKAPYSIRIGYGTGATVQYGGQALDTAKHFVEGKTISMTVPQ